MNLEVAKNRSDLIFAKGTDVEERLTGHAYFYDGAADERRMCDWKRIQASGDLY